MTARSASNPTSRGSSSFWSRMGIVGVLTLAVAVPGALVATCELRDRASKPHAEVVAPAEPAPAEPAPVEPPAELPLEIDTVSLVSLYNDIQAGRVTGWMHTAHYVEEKTKAQAARRWRAG